ncbi:EamA family transporter [candidate division WOR-3 bacterium]|nr:EamA family transporter [candidate division WOR-3 bacterium]MCK4334893.1 EamA family transporter [candidate division WOR-3 bacterium]
MDRALAGISALIAALAFNRALQKGGPLNVVVPLTSQYVLVIVIFSIIFFREPLTWKRIVGIAAAIAAIVFLSL